MPLLEYRCKACSHRFERMVPVGGEGPSECPLCGGATVRSLSCCSKVLKVSSVAGTVLHRRPKPEPAR